MLTIRASGSRPSSRAFSSVVITRQAAPSLRVEALPGGDACRPRGRPASASRASRARCPRAGPRPPRPSPARSPRRFGGASIGAISSAKRPSSRAAHGALVAAERERVLVLARDPVALGDVLARLSHRLGRVALGHPRVDHPPAEGGVVERLLAAGEARARASASPRARGSSTRRRRRGRRRPRPGAAPARPG